MGVERKVVATRDASPRKSASSRPRNLVSTTSGSFRQKSPWCDQHELGAERGRALEELAEHETPHASVVTSSAPTTCSPCGANSGNRSISSSAFAYATISSREAGTRRVYEVDAAEATYWPATQVAMRLRCSSRRGRRRLSAGRPDAADRQVQRKRRARGGTGSNRYPSPLGVAQPGSAPFGSERSPVQIWHPIRAGEPMASANPSSVPCTGRPHLASPAKRASGRDETAAANRRTSTSRRGSCRR